MPAAAIPYSTCRPKENADRYDNGLIGVFLSFNTVESCETDLILNHLVEWFSYNWKPGG